MAGYVDNDYLMVTYGEEKMLNYKKYRVDVPEGREGEYYIEKFVTIKERDKL